MCQLCDASWVHGSLRQCGQENQVINTPQLSMSFAEMEGEIIDVNVGLNQAVRQQFSRYNFHLGNYFKTRLSFIGLMWLVVGDSEDFVPSKKYVEPCDLLDEFP